VAPTKPVARAYVQVFDENGKPVTDPGTVLNLIPLTSSRLEYNRNSYYGTFQAYAPSDEWLVLVNQVDLEDYLAGIIPQEIPPEAPFEVLKAQAVMCRCYALQQVQSGESIEYGYDIPGDQESEWPYNGRSKETPNVRMAVEETTNEVLVDSTGNLATPVYCFSSGGYVADGLSIWGSSGDPVPEYLQARPDFDPASINFMIPENGFKEDETLLEEWLKAPPDTYDRDAAGESFRWKRTLTSDQMDTLANDYWNNQVGQVKSITITERAISGHATRMIIKGSEQTVEARDADTIRDALQLDSSLIIIKENWSSGWVIYGGGLGHGVGLSQCGAIGLVKKKNANYRMILHFYFDRLKLGRRELVRSGTGV
jgi:stage II sporulation protein D